MILAELTKIAQERPVTDADIKAFEQRMEERRLKAKKWERSQRRFDYNFQYTI